MHSAFETAPAASAIPITFATKATWDAICAELPGEARQRSGPEQIAEFAVCVLEAEYDLRDFSVRGGEGEACSGLGREAVGQRELPRLAGKLSADRVPCRLGREGYRNR